jgi:hypothetical protein
MNAMTKKTALEIFALLAAQHRDTPEGHAAVRTAFDLLASLPEPTATDAKGTETVTLP